MRTWQGEDFRFGQTELARQAIKGGQQPDQSTV